MKGRIVFVTGATAGIGEACAHRFAAAGARLLIAGRRKDRLKKVAKTLKKEFGTDVCAVALDVRDRHAVECAIAALPKKWTDIDVLINNAGLGLGLNKLQDGDVDDWDAMIDTNVKGLLYVTRAVVPGMVTRGRGHVINLGSVAGHEVYPNGGVYCASKHAVDALTKGLRMDLVDTPIRVSTVDPGMVETEFSVVRFKGDKDRAKKIYENIEPLTADDIADSVFFCASRPAHVQINEIVITPTHQASALVIHRK